MNAKRLLFLVLTTCLLMACSSDDKTEPVKLPTTGDITVSKSGDTATPQNPAKSEAGKPATVTLLQKASYKDPNGSVYNCEPKSVVTLTTKEQQVKAKSLAELTTIQQNTNQTQTGKNPVTHQTTQIFTLGGQTLTFDLSHEVYTYTTSTNQQIEMPYLKLSAAKNGEAKADTRSAVDAEIAVTGIRLVPVGTRGSYTTEQTYEVHVSFTVDATAMNATTPQNQTLSLEANYLATVETTNEYPDPQTTFSYTISSQGTAGAESPFTMKDKTKQMAVEWNQVAQYTYFSLEELSTKVVTHEPKAKMTLTLEQDTVWAENKEALEAVTTAEPQLSTSGSDPVTTIGKQVIDIGGQKLTLDYSYEAYPNVTVEGAEVPMPYLLLEAPEVVQVTVTETAQTRKAKSRLAGKTYTMHEGQTRANSDSDIDNLQGLVSYYEVTITLRQSLKGVNTPNEVAETVEYVVKYIAAVEAKLISTTYEKDYQWLEPWCDLPWRYNYIVRRVRTYSTGEKETDEFIVPCGGGIGFAGWLNQYTNSSVYKLGNLRFIYHNVNENNNDYDEKADDLRYITTTKTGVPDIGRLSWEFSDDTEDGWTNRDFSNYEIVLSDKKFNPISPEENWYIAGIRREKLGDILYNDPIEKKVRIRYEGIEIYYTDFFFYIDGQIIDFADYRMTYDFDFRIETASLPDGTPAKIFINESNAKYLGKDFYFETVDTVYQLK